MAAGLGFGRVGIRPKGAIIALSFPASTPQFPISAPSFPRRRESRGLGTPFARYPLPHKFPYMGRFAPLGARASRPQSRACAWRALILSFSHKGLTGIGFEIRRSDG